MFGLFNKEQKLPAPVPGMGVISLPQPTRKEKIEGVADFIMGQNRAYRKQFKKKHGRFLPGKQKPIVNMFK